MGTPHTNATKRPKRRLRRAAPAMLAVVVLVSIYSCGGTATVATPSVVLEDTQPLRRECKIKNIRTPEAVKADSLAVVARVRAGAGKNMEAYWISVASVAYYKLALANYELKDSKEKIRRIQASLSRAEQLLQTYKEVVEGLE